VIGDNPEGALVILINSRPVLSDVRRLIERLWRGIPLVFVAFCLAADLPAQEKGHAPKAGDLRDVLQSRTESMKTFQADVDVVARPGQDLPDLAEERRRYAAWVDKNHPELAKDNAQFRAGIERMLKSPTTTYKYKYAVDGAGRIRVERLSDPSEKDAPQPGVVSVRLFNGDEWKSYMESTDRTTGQRKAGLSIRPQERENLSWIEIARGLGIFASPKFQFNALKFDVSRRAAAAQVLGWSEVFRNLPLETSREESSFPPGGGDAKPSLVFESKPYLETGKGLFRLQVWFEPSHGFAICGLTASDLEPAGDGKWDFLPNYTIDWSDPAEVGAVPLYRRSRIRFYEHTPVTDDTKPNEQWAQRAFNTHDFEDTFSNIRVNETVNPADFEITPIAGTNVIDEPKGYTYVVGKAGEELEKTAISERDAAAETQAQRGLSWRTMFIVANVLFLVALIVYWLAIRRKQPGP
jgi:hypothetical protein